MHALWLTAARRMHEERPHRARGRNTLAGQHGQDGQLRQGDAAPRLQALPHRHRSSALEGTKIRLYVADLDVCIMTFDGKLLRLLTSDTTRTYQPSGLPRYRVREVSDVPR